MCGLWAVESLCLVRGRILGRERVTACVFRCAWRCVRGVVNQPPHARVNETGTRRTAAHMDN